MQVGLSRTARVAGAIVSYPPAKSRGDSKQGLLLGSSKGNAPMPQENNLPPEESDYAAPNGVHFKISVTNGYGRWRCVECGKDGFTAHDYGEDADRQAKL